MTNLEQNKKLIDLLHESGRDFKSVKVSFERLLEEERHDYDALHDNQKYDELGLDIGNYVDSLEDAIETLEDIDSKMEDVIEHMNDALQEIDLLSHGY